MTVNALAAFIYVCIGLALYDALYDGVRALLSTVRFRGNTGSKSMTVEAAIGGDVTVVFSGPFPRRVHLVFTPSAAAELGTALIECAQHANRGDKP